MGKVVVTEFMDPDAIDLLGAVHRVIYDPGLALERDRLLEAIHDADGLIVRNRTQVDAGLLAASPRLRVVGRLGVGLDNIEVTACETRGVAVRTAGRANAVAVAEYVVGALLALARPALRATERLLAGEWPRTELVGGELAGGRLGLVGLGGTAREVATRAMGLGMTVLAYDPFVTDAPGIELVELESLFRAANAVSIHVPLTPETVGLVDAGLLTLLQPGTLLVDTSRGGIVDHRAVIAALHEGRLGGAAFDVYPNEPPEDLSIYADAPNLILTPHIAGVTRESNVRVSRVVAEAVLAALAE